MIPQLIASTSADYLAIKESINQINKKIDKLDVSIAKLNQNIEAFSIQRDEKLKEVGSPKNLPNPPPAMGLQNERQQPMENPTAWLSDLDKDTRIRIDTVFKQNALRMRETIKNMGASPENMDREAMQEMIESNQESLKNELKKVLSPEDYEKFLKSLPTPPAPPDLTVLPKK
jgi:septal ring factor EnvC (AmiA/AmiB activator)